MQLRDLRAIDPRFQHQHPVILVRRSSIVVRLEKLKAIISPDQVRASPRASGRLPGSMGDVSHDENWVLARQVGSRFAPVQRCERCGRYGTTANGPERGATPTLPRRACSPGYELRSC
jgi:hypothetical protein